MQHSYWKKQTIDPLYPDLLWARPETKIAAGKLLIIGGNRLSFRAVADAYEAAIKAGVGLIEIVLPHTLRTLIQPLFPGAQFVPSNLSGGLGMQALSELLIASQWADGVLLAGDMGRSSETAALLERFVTEYEGPLTIAQDAADMWCSQPQIIKSRPKTVLVLEGEQLRSLGLGLKLPYALSPHEALMQIVEKLHDVTMLHPALNLIVRQNNDLALIASQGEVITTNLSEEDANPTAPVIAAAAATWWLQHPGHIEASLSSALWALYKPEAY